jgi:hypothetical protein
MHGLALGSLLAAPERVYEGYALGGLPGAASAAGASVAPMLIGPVAANVAARPTLTQIMAAPSLAASAGQRWLTRLGAVAPMAESAMAPYTAQGDKPR